MVSVSSCTITKRTFNRGYSIEWRKRIGSDNHATLETKSEEHEIVQESRPKEKIESVEILTKNDVPTLDEPNERGTLVNSNALAQYTLNFAEELIPCKTTKPNEQTDDEFIKTERVHPLGLRIFVTIVLLICATVVSLYIGFLLGAFFDAFAWVMFGLVFFSFLFNVLNLRFNRKVAHNETEAKENKIHRGILSFFLTVLTVGLASLLLFLG